MKESYSRPLDEFLDHMVEPQGLLHFPNSRSHSFEATRIATGSLGSFETLPLEVTHTILENVDFEALYVVKLLNSKSRAIVNSLPAYRAMAEHAPGVLRSLNVTESVDYVTTGELFAAFSNRTPSSKIDLNQCILNHTILGFGESTVALQSILTYHPMLLIYANLA